MTESSMISELLESGLTDWVSLHDVVWLGTRGDITPKTTSAVISALEYLYSNDLMVPGDLGPSGFEDWESQPQGWIRRSQAELDRLDWRPMASGFWLRLTPRGERRARHATAHADDEPT